MLTHLKKRWIFVFLIVCLALYVSVNLLPGDSAQARTYKSWPWAGTTLAWAHVQMGTSAKAYIVINYPPDTKVTVYATVYGRAVQYGNPYWYRISRFGSFPLYIYSKFVAPLNSSWGKNSSTFPIYGKAIVISLSQERLYAYQSGKQVFSTAVITGRSTLPTPTGTFHVFAKLNHTTFYSPWSRSSPYWYTPTSINYALEFLRGGYYLHDSWWHTVYGPGTSNWHYDPAYGWQWGTHGCVAMPNTAAYWLYNWAPVGITVQINK